MIEINEDLCDGCGLCVTGCHEGALQIIDGKAVIISDMYCDGLGACIGDCPQGAITLIERVAEPYDEIAVMERIVHKGEEVVLAHLKHMKDFNEIEFLNQGIQYLKDNNIDIDLSSLELDKMDAKEEEKKDDFAEKLENIFSGGSCPSNIPQSFNQDNNNRDNNNSGNSQTQRSELTHWPIQLHLQNPESSYFRGADVLIAADCTAFSIGEFHPRLLKNKVLSIACPKLDSNKDVYVEKIISMIDNSKINTLTIAVMEVPCCAGLTQLALQAKQRAKRNVPIKKVMISVQGEILEEDWI